MCIRDSAITNLYVDSVDENKLVEDAIRGMLEKLDPHSSYATAKEPQAMNEPRNGSFDGIGVQFNICLLYTSVKCEGGELSLSQ